MQLVSLPSLRWWTFLGQPHRHRFELISTKKWCCMVSTIWVVECFLVSVPTWWCHSVLLAEPLGLMVNSFRFCSWFFPVWFLWVANMWWQYYPDFCLARFSYGWVQNSWHFGFGTLYAFCELMSIALCGPWFLWNSACKTKALRFFVLQLFRGDWQTDHWHIIDTSWELLDSSMIY